MASIKQRLARLAVLTDQRELLQLFNDLLTDATFLRDRLKSQLVLKAGIGAVLVINGAGGLTAKVTNAFYAWANGVLVTKAAATAMAALAGSVTNAKFNVYCFFIDSAGVLTSAMGTEGATLAAVVPPAIPAGKAQIGMVVVNPTGAGNFVGGTTALDDVGVVPNAVFIDTPGPQDPSSSLLTIS